MDLGNSWQALLENPLGSLIVLLIALFVIWHVPGRPSYGRFSSGASQGLDWESAADIRVRLPRQV